MKLQKAEDIIDAIARETDSVLLFHSLSGKDSIALLEMLYPKFRRVVCCFMYVVPDPRSDFDGGTLRPARLEHNQRYVNFIRTNYPEAEIVTVPHYALLTYYKTGYMGMPSNPGQRQWRLSEIADRARKATGTEWCCFGMKMSDGMNRRLMLRNYRDGAICDATRKFYPLSAYTSAQVMRFIHDRDLIEPERYDGTTQSAGENIADKNFLKFLRDRYPNDYRTVCTVFPRVRFMELGKNEEDGRQRQKHKA